MLYQLSYAPHIALPLCLACEPMAHPAGLEPATIRLEGGCSIQLSYGRLVIANAGLSHNAWVMPRIQLSGCAWQAGRMLGTYSDRVKP